MFKTPPMKEKTMTKVQRLFESVSTRIAIVNNHAYWIKDNKVYRSNLDDDGRIDMDTASIIDVFSLNEKETNNLLKIIDNLSE